MRTRKWHESANIWALKKPQEFMVLWANFEAQKRKLGMAIETLGSLVGDDRIPTFGRFRVVSANQESWLRYHLFWLYNAQCKLPVLYWNNMAGIREFYRLPTWKKQWLTPQDAPFGVVSPKGRTDIMGWPQPWMWKVRTFRIIPWYDQPQVAPFASPEGNTSTSAGEHYVDITSAFQHQLAETAGLARGLSNRMVSPQVATAWLQYYQATIGGTPNLIALLAPNGTVETEAPFSAKTYSDFYRELELNIRVEPMSPEELLAADWGNRPPLGIRERWNPFREDLEEGNHRTEAGRELMRLARKKRVLLGNPPVSVLAGSIKRTWAVLYQALWDPELKSCFSPQELSSIRLLVPPTFGLDHKAMVWFEGRQIPLEDLVLPNPSLWLAKPGDRWGGQGLETIQDEDHFRSRCGNGDIVQMRIAPHVEQFPYPREAAEEILQRAGTTQQLDNYPVVLLRQQVSTDYYLLFNPRGHRVSEAIVRGAPPKAPVTNVTSGGQLGALATLR